MKKMTKILCRVLPVVLVGLLVVSNVFGVTFNSTMIPSGTNSGSGTVEKLTGNIWGTVITIVRILAVAAVVFAGVRYMMASANDKADIKKQMVILVIGAVMVFGATFLLNIISNVTNETVNGAV